MFCALSFSRQKASCIGLIDKILSQFPHLNGINFNTQQTPDVKVKNEPYKI